MKYYGILGILTTSIGGAFLIYVLSSIIINAGYQQSQTIYELDSLKNLSILGGFIAFLLIAAGIWIIIQDVKPENQTSARKSTEMQERQAR